MAALGFSESAMGQHSNANDPSKVYLLHGWRGNEDEYVDIDSSDGSSQGEVGDSKKLSEPDVRALAATCSNGQLKTSVEETFEGADQECESRASVEAKDWQVTAGRVTSGKSNKDLEGPGAHKSMSCSTNDQVVDDVMLHQQKKANEGKRLDARRFRNIFAAKLSGSKKSSSTGEGKELGDAGHGMPGQVASNSSQELSGGAPTVIVRQAAQKGGTDEIERETSDAEALPKYVQDKLASFSDVREKSRALNRKRKVVNRIEDISKVGKDRSPPPVIEASEENLLGRSKRVRKDNMQKDYISWSDFGRSSSKRNGRVSVEASRRSTDGKEGTSSCGKAFSQVAEVHPEDVARCVSTEMKLATTNVVTLSLGSDIDLKACESTQQGETNQQNQKKININSQDVDGHQNKAVCKSTLPPMHVAEHSRSGEFNCEDVGQEMSGRPESCDKSCELVVLLNSGAIHESEVSQESAETNGICFAKDNEGDGALSSIVRTDLKTSERQLNETFAEDPKRDNGSEPLLIGDTHALEPLGYSDNHDSVCNWCKKEGNLICCDGKGCKLTYHITCLDPPLTDVPPNDWYCPDCTYKRIMWGLHSVSKGLESIWDVKEGPLDEIESTDHIATHKAREQHGQVADGEGNGSIDQHLAEIPRCDGVAAQAKGTAVMYYVKYKGLAHAHNKWLPESQVLKEAPKLLHTFKKKLEQGKACKWDPEWARPSRVIGKRVTMLRKSPNSILGEGVQSPDSCLEWCVRWRNLGYELCTWEPASKGPLCNAEGKELIKDYELRSERAKERIRGGRKHLVEDLSPSLFVDSNKLAGSVKGEQLDHLQQDVVIRLCKFWDNGINGIVVADAVQERVITTAMFLRCLLDIYQAVKPVLIVAPPASIGLWEATFQEWAPAINVVVNGGTKEARQIVQRYEFYNEDKLFMAQIVLTSFDTLNL